MKQKYVTTGLCRFSLNGCVRVSVVHGPNIWVFEMRLSPAAFKVIPSNHLLYVAVVRMRNNSGTGIHYRDE